MPAKKSMSMKKPALRRRRRVVRKKAMIPRSPRRVYGSQQFARVVETYPAQNINANTTYLVNDIDLLANGRAEAVAKQYQFFRISRVQFRWKTIYDSYIAGVGTTSVPQLYWRIDREGTFPINTTLQDLKNSGCKPKRFDDGNAMVSFKPAVSIGTTDQSGVSSYSGPYKISPWLPTQNASTNVSAGWAANSTAHRGIVFQVEQALPAGTACQLEVTVVYEFKQPLTAFGSEAPNGTILQFGNP